MASRQELVDMLWQKIYSATQSQSKPQTWGSYVTLPPKFDQELLNSISDLKKLELSDLPDAFAAIRSNIAICESVGLIGSKDIELINVQLDSIAEIKE